MQRNESLPDKDMDLRRQLNESLQLAQCRLIYYEESNINTNESNMNEKMSSKWFLKMQAM